MSLLRFACLTVMTIALSGVAQAATVDFVIDQITKSPTGASFVIKAVPDSNIAAVGAYAVNMRFDGFVGGIGSPLSINISELYNPAVFTAPATGSSPGTYPTNVSTGNILTYTGVYSGAVGANPGIALAGADLFKVDVTVPGGFNPGNSFTVNLIGLSTDGLTPTAVDANDTAPLRAERIFQVPEPSSLSLMGLASMMIGLGFRRR